MLTVARHSAASHGVEGRVSPLSAWWKNVSCVAWGEFHFCFCLLSDRQCGVRERGTAVLLCVSLVGGILSGFCE